MDEIGHEEDDEGHGSTNQTYAATGADILVVDIVHDIEDAQHTGEEDDGEAQHEHPGIEQGIETVRGVGPATDDGCDGADIDEVVFLDDEVGALEESGDGASQEQRTHDAVQREEELEGLGTKEIADLVLELIADGLEYEGEEDEHPEPVGTTETRGIEEWEGGKECASEGDEGGEGELPLTAGGVVDEAFALFCPAQTAGHGVGTLHKQ